VRALWIAGLVAGLAGCKEGGSISVPTWTVHAGEGGGCTLVADLVSTRDSSNVDLTLRACAGERCSAETREMTEGPFVPGRAKTVQVGLGGCPEAPDRIEVSVSRWGSANNPLSRVEVARVERAAADGGGCEVRVVLRSIEQSGDALVFLVARDRAWRPLERTLPFSLPEGTPMTGHPAVFAARCETIETVELQVVT
jgi:hypothetical protein